MEKKEKSEKAVKVQRWKNNPNIFVAARPTMSPFISLVLKLHEDISSFPFLILLSSSYIHRYMYTSDW